jgi:hypothetical protein
LPALVECTDGRFVVLGRVLEDKVLIQNPGLARPQLVARAEFEATWSGWVVLIARRATLGELSREFNIAWFVQAIHKLPRSPDGSAGRVVLPAGVRAGHAAVLPGGDRQGAGASRPDDARRADHRAGRRIDLRDGARRLAPTCSPTPPTVSTSSSGRGSIAT